MKKLVLCLAILTLAALPVTATADVAVDPIYWSGAAAFRTTPATKGVTATGEWIEFFKVSWDIQYGPSNSYIIYKYKFEVNDKDFSHIILETSKNTTRMDFFDFTWQYVEGPKTWNPDPLNTGDNPGMPGDLYGIKFDKLTGETFEVMFSSKRLPMWGDFYAKDGRSPNLNVNVYAYNTNFGNDPIDKDFTGHIPVPDTVVPLPGALLLLGGGLVRLLVWRRQ